MATLTSRGFTRDPQVKERLRKCANDHAFNIFEQNDPQGDHVSQIQAALVALVPAHGILQTELDNGFFGPTTAQAVFKFKDDPKLNGTNGKILGAGQLKPDKVVGIQTIAALDRQMLKAQPGPDVPPVVPPPEPEPETGKFAFIAGKLPLLIKAQADALENQDLENAPVGRRGATINARIFSNGSIISNPSEAECKGNLRLVISAGGPFATEMAEFFFNNQQTPKGNPRDFRGDHFWVKQVRQDRSFTGNQARLAAAIEAALQELGDGSPLDPKVVDVNKLADQSLFQPRNFAAFANIIDFSFQKDKIRAVTGDPLAFGIGSIQGMEVRITEFKGEPDGKYLGKLQFILIDHFGANDSDVIDPGQAGLWLLQRKMADGQGKRGCEPYRVRIFVDNVVFSGKLT